jgi:autotransporter-associated beta strand protein
MSHLVKSAISGGKIMNKAVCFLAIFVGLLIPKSHAQTTVNYTMQDANFPTQFNSGGDFFNNGSTELGMWANSNAKQTVGWQNFTTTGAVGGTARNLQVGDVFITTVAATRAFGQIGFSLNAGGTQGSSYANNISGSRMYISTDNNAAWSVKGLSGGATSSLSYVPLQDTFKDYRFTVRITSQTTADVYLTVDGTDYRAYNLALAGSAGANISAFSIFGSDMWDGNSNENAFWKQTTSVQNSGRVELGYFASGATSTTPGLITDGLAANSTSVTSANAVFIGGNAGSQVNLNQANTYTGQTTVNSAARLEVQNAGALGGTSNGTTVSDGGALSLYQATGGITVANEALNLAGTGVSGANGALRNTGGNNAWNGTVTLGANTRINADTTGSSGSLTIGGNISGGSNVLFMGAQGASGANTGGDITVNGVISGEGGTHNSIITSLYKDGAGTLTLSGANTYSGATTVNAGLLKVVSGGAISSSTTVNNGGTFDVGGTAGNVQVNNGGLLKGSGSAGAVTFQSGSLLNPGNSPGTLTAASATVLGGSTYNWEISALTGTAGTTWDLFSVGGLLNMSGVTSGNKWNLVVTGDSGFTGWTGTSSYSYVFAQAASVSGFSSTVGTDVTSLFNITTSGISSKPNASFNVNGDFKVVVGSANGFTTLNLMAVPEPSSGSLLLAGIGCLIVLRRFRKNA